MALVKCSGDFRQRVSDMIDNMRRKEFNEFSLSDRFTIPHDDPRILKWAFGEYVDLFKQCPPNWFSKKGEVSLRTRGYVPLDMGEGRTESVNISMLVQPIPSATGPENFLYPADEQYRPIIHYATYEDMVADWPEMTGWRETKIAQINCINKWNKIKADVLAFFETFPSVNAALKHTPAMAMYMHPDDVERVETKKEKPKPQEVTPAVDVDALVGAVAAHRMGV